MRFKLSLRNPCDRLIRTDKLTYPTEATTIQLRETAICTPLRAIKFRHNDSPLVRPPTFLKDMIRADHHAEVAPFAPCIIDDQFHATETLWYIVLTLFDKHLLIDSLMTMAAFPPRLKPDTGSSINI